MTTLTKTSTLALCRTCFDHLTAEQYAALPLASVRFEHERDRGPGCDYDRSPRDGWPEATGASVYSVTFQRAIDAPGR